MCLAGSVKKPMNKGIKSIFVSSVMFLSEFKKNWPCEIREPPWWIPSNQLFWWAYYLVLVWT